jgi:hypothetical protein
VTAGLLRSVGQAVLSASPWAPAPSPATTSAVDEGYLARVFSARAPGARPTSIERAGRHSGTTDRQPLQVTWNEAGRRAELPERLFLKGTPPTAKSRLMVGPLDMAVNEVRFYERVQPDIPHIAPQVYAAHAGSGARHLMVLEDVVGSGGQAFLISDECTLEHARAVMKVLGTLHGQFAGSPRLQTDLSFAKPMTSRAGAPMLRLTMRKLRNWYLKAPDERPVPPAVTRLLRTVQDNDKRLYRMFEQGPQTFLHGDSHLGNTFRRADGSAGLLDWQVVWQGRGVREVAYFIGTSVDTEIRRAHEKELLELYLETVREQGVTAPMLNDAWDDYRFFMFDVWDSGSICEMWPGLQTEESVARSRRLVDAVVEDLEVDQAVARAVQRG